MDLHNIWYLKKRAAAKKNKSEHKVLYTANGEELKTADDETLNTRI